ncbi:MAG TPA: hypothetical protein VF701_18205 [Thermoanaerobaculia bacterium]
MMRFGTMWKRGVVVVALSIVLPYAADVNAQTVGERIAIDAAAIDRVAEVSQRDLPVALLKRIVDEDIELMRGPRPDGTYEHATWERFEASRLTSVFAIRPRGDEMQSVEMKGPNVYRVIVGVPGRRLLVRQNRPIWIERVDAEYVGDASGRIQQTSIPVQVWLQPGELRTVDLPTISRQATVRVVATADKESGTGNIDVSLVQARIVDSVRSPYAAAIVQAKALPRLIDGRDIEAIRIAAQRMRAAVPSAGVAGTQAAAIDRMDARSDLQRELREIDELLRGGELERWRGLDRLQSLIRSFGP